MHDDPMIEPYTRLHRDGIRRRRDASEHAEGRTPGDGTRDYEEWFRPDGTILRSGRVESGRRVGEWAACDAAERTHRTPRGSSD